MTTTTKRSKKRKSKPLLCPACGEALTVNGRYPATEPGPKWLECVSDGCDLLGLEGLLWHWETIAQWKERSERAEQALKELSLRAEREANNERA